MAKSLTLPLNDEGLYKAADILKMQSFPYGKTWLYKNIQDNGQFIRPVKKGSSNLFRGRDVNNWFNDYIVISKEAA